MARPFLGSRIGLRVLLMFIVAAGAPMLLLATLSQQAVDDTINRSDTALLSTAAKSSGMQTLERLRVARLAMLSDPRATDASSPRQTIEPLLALVAVDRAGVKTRLLGSAEDAALLDAALLRADAPARTEARAEDHLRTVNLPGRAQPGVVLEVASAGAERSRLALVNPTFLWDGADEQPAAVWLCAVEDVSHRALFCSDPSKAEIAVARSRDTAAKARTPDHSVWALFLRTDFAAPAWSFVAGFDRQAAGAGAAGGLRRMVPVAAVAGLLLAVLLSLVQIRRTLHPLAQLIAGARQLAHRRFAAPIGIPPGNEFGELAAAFNQLSTRLGAQFAELESLAAIDREVVSQASLQRIHQLILSRLSEVLPERPLALVQMPVDGQLEGLRVGWAGDAAIAPFSMAIDTASAARLTAWPMAEGADGVAATPALAHALTDSASSTTWPLAKALPLRWRDRCFGFVVVGLKTEDDIDPDSLRQLTDLRNRGAVAASAAERERVLLHEARYDQLTGLLNRQGLHEHLVACLAGAEGDHPGPAVLFIDLDRFKTINDSLGHAAGDQALRQVAERLRACLPAGAVAARQAGDEFVIVLADTATSPAALAQSVCHVLGQAVIVDGTAFLMGASVGVAVCDAPATTPETLLRHADQAMYRAKRLGGGRHWLFNADLDAASDQRTWIERDLPFAADRGELRLLYQPRITAANGQMESVEALVRWQHPVHGLCMPGDFIPVAEASDLIEHIGRWVIDTACAQVRTWQDAGHAALRIAVNLSARQIGSDRLLNDLDASFERHGIAAESLELEITESMFVEQTASTIDRLQALRQRGMVLALDDFGTGYSSLSYLRTLPINVLKIDRAFVKDLGDDPSALAVARAIVALATSLGMRTVAEGVETIAQLRLLELLGCDELQGYFFSRPVDAAALMQLGASNADWRPRRIDAAEPALV